MPLRHIVRTKYPLFGAPGVPTWNFHPSLVTFAEKMAKRTAPGPFAAAPIVQGKWDTTGTPDLLSAVRGSQISGDFYANFDTEQGAIVFWITPEWAGDDNKQYYILRGSSGYLRVKKHTDNTLQFTLPTGGSISPSISAWVAGTKYCVELRWNSNNKLDGTNYACVSINDTHTFGMVSAPTLSSEATYYIGCKEDPSLGANAIIEGLTIYRRPLWDGTYGVDAGNGDEINLIHASGAGKKPEEVTGADDICFQLPTDGSTGELATGTGEAWSWPWADNELTNWHLQNETGGAPDNWAAINAPTLADAETANILFDTRSQKMSVNAADEGIRGDASFTAGEDYVVWAWVKTGGANQGVDLRIYDLDNTTNIMEMTTDSSSWTLFNTCYEVPAGCSGVHHFIESTDADTYNIYVGQCQVLPNLVDNGGMEGTYDDEAGGGGGTIMVAPGWGNHNCETDGTDELSKSADAHSGSASQKIDVSGSNEGIKTDANCFTANKWHCVTLWVKGTSGNVAIFDAAVSFLNETITSPAASWVKYSYVVYADSARAVYVASTGAGADFLVDDISIIELADVSITATAANEANSTEDSGIRVDGLDSCTQPIAGLGATSGKIRFNWCPRHGGDKFKAFTLLDPPLITVYKDANNSISYVADTSDDLKLSINVAGGGSETDSWDASAVVAGTTYLIEIEYNSTQVTVKHDGVVKATVAYTGGIDFGANIPDTAYIGQNTSNERQIDAVFSQP